MNRPLIGITANHNENNDRLWLNKPYIEAVMAAGGLPVILPTCTDMEMIREYIFRIDGLLLTGGADLDPLVYGEEPLTENGQIDPLRDKFEIELFNNAYQEGTPILGICKGCQVINVALGGSLYQDIHKQGAAELKHNQEAPRWYPTHSVDIREESILFNILVKKEIRVNSTHHQAIKDVARGLIVSAKSADGIVEAIEIENNGFVLGVQWHPETMWEKDQHSMDIFRRFVKESSV